MHAPAPLRTSRLLTSLTTLLLLAACGQGDGPQSIPNQPATPLPPLPPGFCDAINFEILCDSPGIINFGGGITVTLDNPDPDDVNDSDRVARMQKFADQPFGGTLLDTGAPYNFSLGEVFTVKVWASRPVPLTFKLDQQNVEQIVSHSGSGEWEELCFDFTGGTTAIPNAGLTLIFDDGVVGQGVADPDNWTFYYDDILQVESCDGSSPIPPTWSTITFDDPALNYGLSGFGGGDDSTLVADPADATNQVVRMNRSDSALVFAGVTVFLGPNEAVPVIPLDDSDPKMNVRVRSPGMNIPVRLKIEDASDGDVFVEAEVLTNAASTWETLEFDFAMQASNSPMYDPAVDYNKITIFPNFGTDGATAGAQTYYFDDFAVGAGSGGPGPGPADPGEVPEVIISAVDGSTPDLMPTYDPFGSGTMITQNFTGDSSYGNAVEASVGAGYGGGALAQMGLTTLGAGFATGYGEFLFKVKGLDADNTILAKLEEPFPGTSVPVQIDLTAPPANVAVTDLGDGWSQVVIQMAAYGDVSTFSQIVFQTLDGAYTAGTPIYLADIGFNNAGGGGGGVGGEIATNGGFEDGDFTGWTQFESAPGNQTVNASMAGDTSSEGSFHLEINNTVADTNSLIKQERVGEGTVTPGIGWTVTFDARGEFNPGGVAFAQVFSETAAGNENCTGCGILGGAPLGLNADPTVWTSFSFSGTAGPTTESLTLQLEAVSGAGGLANVFYDNISIVVN